MSVPGVARTPRALPDLDALAVRFEARRVATEAAVQARTVPAVALGVGGAVAIGIVLALSGAPWFFVLASGLPGVAAWRWRRQPRLAYLRRVKDEVYPEAVCLIGPDWQYRRTGAVDLASLKPFGILPGHDRERQSDWMAGTWAGIRIEMSEAKLTEERGSGNNRHRVTTFAGVIVRMTMPEGPRGRILIRRRFGTAPLFSGLKRVRLETSRFEKAFNVYADDQVEARRVLTVTVMERFAALSDDLMRLGGGLPSERLEASFVDGDLLALVPCRTDLFEPKPEGGPLHVRQDLERLIAEIRDVLRIAEALGLGR